MDMNAIQTKTVRIDVPVEQLKYLKQFCKVTRKSVDDQILSAIEEYIDDMHERNAHRDYILSYKVGNLWLKESSLEVLNELGINTVGELARSTRKRLFEHYRMSNEIYYEAKYKLMDFAGLDIGMSQKDIDCRLLESGWNWNRE